MKIIPLTQGFVAWVDDEDYESLSRYKWHVKLYRRSVVAQRRERSVDGVKGPTRAMHREIMTAPDGVDIDHIRHPPIEDRVIDNRRENLRIATRAQNLHNARKMISRPTSSPFKGVSWHVGNEMWRCDITVMDKQTTLGYFHSEINAAYAYDLEAVRIRGDRALTNFPIPGSANWIFGFPAA